MAPGGSSSVANPARPRLHPKRKSDSYSGNFFAGPKRRDRSGPFSPARGSGICRRETCNGIARGPPQRAYRRHGAERVKRRIGLAAGEFRPCSQAVAAQLGSARVWDSLMTWVTLSNGACPRFFPLEAGIFDLARPLIFRGEKGITPKQKCRGVHAPIMVLLRGKSVTHVMRSRVSRAGERVLAIANFLQGLP